MLPISFNEACITLKLKLDKYATDTPNKKKELPANIVDFTWMQNHPNISKLDSMIQKIINYDQVGFILGIQRLFNI